MLQIIHTHIYIYLFILKNFVISFISFIEKMSNSSRGNGNGDSTIPINIPTTQTARHRRRGTGNLSNFTHSLAGTLQSWTGNYSLTAR